MKSLRILAFFSLLIASSSHGQNPEERFTAMSPEQRRSFEMEVMEKVADLALIPPKLNTSHPDGFQSPDGTIYISYDHNRGTDGEILLARFTEEDVLAKKLVGPKSKLKTLISRPLKGK